MRISDWSSDVCSSDLLRVDSATTVQPANPALDENGPPVFQSVSMQCNDRPFRGSNGPDDAAVRAIFELGTNNRSTYTSSLTDLFVNGATETALTPFDAATLDDFFDTTAYEIGRAACRASVCKYELIQMVALSLK